MSHLRRLLPQPLTGIVASLLAFLLLAWSNNGILFAPPEKDIARTVLIAALLITAIAWTYLYPIHIRQNTKVSMASVPLYLTAVLLLPPVAALCSGVGVLAGQILVVTRRKRRKSPGRIATSAARWVIVTYAAALVAHLPQSNEIAQILLLLLTALVMFAGDFFTFTFEVAPITGEPFWRVIIASIREGGLIEGVQYLIGMLGALAATQQVWGLALLALPTAIVYVAFKHLKEMRDTTSQILEGMADAVDLRDPYTGGHSRRVAESCDNILKNLDLAGPESELIRVAARVHDIGKIGIPDDILRKTGALNAEEWRIMKEHCQRGAELLARYPDFARGADFVRHHHERWDGQGYPRGLKGLEIPLGARVIAVVDALDAMTSDRPYRKAMSLDQALLILRAGSGQQWDPAVVDALLRSQHAEVDEPKLSLYAQPGQATASASD
ncbi:MAG: HD-GYP domain-containing protein [Chloroflexi bacterium]|nr:HD-GYP domain-containing protein [Chloroflexota bacterium]